MTGTADCDMRRSLIEIRGATTSARARGARRCSLLGMDDRAAAIVRFWLGEPGADMKAHVSRWFTRDLAFDDDIRARFGADVERALRGELDAWGKGDAREALALVIVLDQFPRNIFRDAARAFAGDARALD